MIPGYGYIYAGVVMFSLLGPFLAWRLGAAGGFSAAIITVYAAVLTARNYEVAETGGERDVLLATGLVLSILLILDMLLVIYRSLRQAKQALPETAKVPWL